MASAADAVTALVHAYAERLDAGDLDGVAQLFARARWRSPQHPDGLRGAAAVRRVYDGVVFVLTVFRASGRASFSCSCRAM